MTRDPADDWETVAIARPPSRGPGSDKEAWVAFAEAVTEANLTAWGLVDAQSKIIAALEAEVAQLRAQLAERKGGRPKTSESTAAMIRADLAAGLSQRQAADRNGVSVMTVSRLAREPRP